MANLDSQFSGSIPEIYDRYLEPVLFGPYAEELAKRVARLAPHSVLETAAGTGIVTRALLKALPETAVIVATDLNQPMVDYAAAKAASPRVSWRQADATTLPFENESFDLVLCQFGVMFFPDKVAAHREALRVLKRGGHFLFNVWGPIASNDFTVTVTEAMATMFPHDPPWFFERIPHGYHDTAIIRRELEMAGFTDVRIETVERESRAASAREAAIGLCQGTPLRNEIEARGGPGLDEATEAATRALATRFGAGAVTGRLQALVIEAMK